MENQWLLGSVRWKNEQKLWFLHLQGKKWIPIGALCDITNGGLYFFLFFLAHFEKRNKQKK